VGEDLAGMTNEELWRLFPIILREHDESWPGKYLSEKTAIENIAGRENIARINHIGSTSVPGLLAKPTIDILVEIRKSCDTEKLVAGMTAGGYIYLNKPENPPPHMLFMKGYTPQGFRGQAFHVHVRYGGDWAELYFRDYLADHKEVADEYAALKAELRKKYEHDRDGYTDAKSDFINAYTRLARREYGGRYGLREEKPMSDNSVYKVEKLFEGAWSIDEGNVRCFLITGSEKALLIDTGYGGGDLLSLVKGLTDLPVKLVLTHTDGDHTGAMEQFPEAYMHPAEFENYRKKGNDMNKPPVKPLWEGDVIDLGGVSLEVVLIPGHTPGSIALWEKEKNIIFTGDSVSKVPIFMFGMGRNMEAYICSMEKLLHILPEGISVYASHGQKELDPSLLPHLIAGASDVLAGNVAGVKPERDLPCLQYNCGEVKFLY
jgi:glyoxylase-like metal-dependent hydrolase (beta-lactamase superfamily II)/GrpB-like predicted nucleotidyltransferase (UPF0157 family)